LRESDPQRYAEIRERMRNLNERMNSAMGHQQEFLSALATDQMSEDQAASHEAFLELLARNREILGLMEVNPETENAGELRRELRENMRQVGELLGVEREIALQAMARDLGYEGEAIPQFQQYVESILDMTSVRSLWSGRSGRGGGPRSDSTRPAAPADTRP